MALTKLTKDMAIIQKLDDEPNDVGGLTAAQLKAKFDEAGEAIKAFLNDTLLPELGADDAGSSLNVVLNGTKMSIGEALEQLQKASTQAGNVPVGGNAGDILRKKTDEQYDLEWQPLFTRVAVTLTASGWTGGVQTAAVPGVSADETAQLILPVAAAGSEDGYEAAMIRARPNGANSLKFVAETAPTEDLTVYVLILEVVA